MKVLIVFRLGLLNMPSAGEQIAGNGVLKMRRVENADRFFLSIKSNNGK